MKIGIPVLKRNTPKGGGRNVRATISKGEFKTDFRRRGGALRRAATVNSKYYGRNKDGSVVGRLGFKYGTESRKAIWLEFGTKHITPRQFVQRTYEQIKTPASKMLIGEMRKALDRACAELAAGKNPGGAPGFRRKR